MKNNKRKKKTRSVTIDGIQPMTGNLTQRVDTAKIVYGLMGEIATPGPDGVPRAFVDIESDSIEVTSPSDMTMAMSNNMYGLKPSSMASETEPFPLIPKYDEPDFTENPQRESRSQLRQILRRLVDEV